MENFKVGELVIYIDKSLNAKIGKIKSLYENGAFVYYHEGDTASKTNYADLYKLKNSYVIKKEKLGGDNF